MKWTKDKVDFLIENKDVLTRKELGQKLGVSIGAIKMKLRHLGLKKKRVVSDIKKLIYFDTVDTPEKAYFLGLLASDGHVIYNEWGKNATYKVAIALSESDSYILNSFKQWFPEGVLKHYFSHHTYAKKGCKYSRFSIYNKYLTKQIIELGIPPSKTFTLKYPTIPADFHRFFILGYFDGDGCISKTTRKGYPIGCWGWYVYSGSKVFLRRLRNIIKHSLNVRLPLEYKQKMIFRLGVSHYQSIYRILHWLYHGHNLGLKRKRELAIEFISLYEERQSQMTLP